MRQIFSVPNNVSITRETTSVDINGWDSLSHSLFILGVEDEFGLDLPLDKTYELRNIGDLVDLIRGAV
jgi:acyl carrier protein